ncbi:MAG TPA: M48 family metallopeptidase [Arachidicoccus sp.]|nr:M48 family metallopeptidase [Arachidicoccus sp.]
MLLKKLALTTVGLITLFGCARNAISGRSQLMLTSESDLQAQAFTEYKSFLAKNKVVTASADKKDYEVVQRVGKKIAAAITNYYSQKGLSKELSGYKWEFNLVESKDVNAWCMPGGKVVVYTGLLPVAQNETGLAIVMGHEIAHAVLHHGQERVSQQQAASVGGALVGTVLNNSRYKVASNVFNSIYAPTAQMAVILPNSRQQESEADHYGLIFAAMAGYDPALAIPFWQRMEKMSGGDNTPTLLRSHPSNATRIADIRKIMPEAEQYYKKAR